jgi:hypothetical protein
METFAPEGNEVTFNEPVCASTPLGKRSTLNKIGITEEERIIRNFMTTTPFFVLWRPDKNVPGTKAPYPLFRKNRAPGS